MEHYQALVNKVAVAISQMGTRGNETVVDGHAFTQVSSVIDFLHLMIMISLFSYIKSIPNSNHIILHSKRLMILYQFWN